MSLIFDTETNGLLDETTEMHCLVIYDTVTDTFFEYNKNTGFEEGINKLNNADEIAGHNIVKFDIPVMQKLFGAAFNPKGHLFDTLLMSKLVYPDIGLKDDVLILKNKFPKVLRGKYSLRAWGYRLHCYKGDFSLQEDCWEEWSQEMQDYCKQDVAVTSKLFKCLKNKNISEESRELEHHFATVIQTQIQRGVYFDKDKAVTLAGELTAQKLELEKNLCAVFQPKVIKTPFTPKADNIARGYRKGVTIIKTKTIPFNPSSRDMVAEQLIAKYEWKPKILTPTGKPVINEEVLNELNYPEASMLKDYFLVTKTLGQLTEGKNAWLKLEKNSIIHGGVDTIGAVTGRCTHINPNLAQVPAVGHFMGEECRSLFKARDGYNLVGCDASGLELRCLAHYMGDNDYTHEILNGDIHTKNQLAAGLPTRAEAKRFIYAFIYGGGDALIGSLVGGKSKEGKQIKEKFLSSLPALKNLIDRVKNRVNSRGYLYGLDKRVLTVRESYKGLNVLLQSAGAIVMKKALCILYDRMISKGWKLYDDFAFVLNIHDEYQCEIKPELTEEYMKMAVQAIRDSGKYFNFKCPLDGEAKVGKTWADTH